MYRYLSELLDQAIPNNVGSAHLDCILLPSSLARDRQHIEQYVTEFVDELMVRGATFSKEVSQASEYIFCVTQYCGYVGGGGHASFIACEWSDLGGFSEGALAAFRTVGATLQAEVIEAAMAWMRSHADKARPDLDFTDLACPELEALDYLYDAAERAEQALRQLSAWVSAGPLLRVVKDEDYPNVLRSLLSGEAI